MGMNYTCVLLSVAPLLYLLSDLLPLPHVRCIQTMWDCGGGGCVEMYCGPYSAGVLHSVSDQIRNIQNCFTAPNKMTSEDDIKGLVSLKFLRPCFFVWISSKNLASGRKVPVIWQITEQPTDFPQNVLGYWHKMKRESDFEYKIDLVYFLGLNLWKMKF